ncbi:hypothetical protein FOZ63_016959 [Perkinsus olseni]|uniref:Uncharacterized protein n=1 Tax=Perkinsus olseni TaxID=32597 RepID=A0A7J6UDF8_PEROL|nr:hypothetical protein FOZ63_016959 [Perkinsus olseni]
MQLDIMVQKLKPGLLKLVIAILLSAVHELEKVDEMVGLREFEVAVPPTPVTTRCTPTTEGIRADAGLDRAYCAHAHFSLWATFNCPWVTIALPSPPLSVTSNGQKMTLMSNADGSFSQLWEIGAPSGVTSDRGDESHRRVLSIGQSSAANAELGLVDELRGATVDELQGHIRCRLEGSEGKNCIIRVSGGSPRECDVAIEGIGPLVFWIDWPLLYDVCKLATRLSLIITLVNNLTAEWYRLVGYLDTAAICSSAGIESWIRWSASLPCTNCSIWVPLEDHLGSSPLGWKSWGGDMPPIVVADFHLAYSAVWSSGEPQPLGWYKDVITTVTLSQSTISLGTSKCKSTVSWRLRGSTSHKIVDPFHARLLFKSKEKGRTLKTNVEVDPVKIVLSTSDIVIIGAIAEICASLYAGVDADCHKLSLDIGLPAAQGQPNGVEGETQPSSYPPSESSDVVTSPREVLSTRFAFKVDTLQVEIVDAGTATVFRGSRSEPSFKFAMATIEDLSITASSEVDITFASDLSSAVLQEWLLDLSLGVDVFNRPLSGYEPCVEPVQLHMVLSSGKGGHADDLWRLALSSTWVNILITECCLESVLAFYHSLVNRLQEFSSTIDEIYHREWVLDSAQNSSPKRVASPRLEPRSVKVTFAAPVHESSATRMPGQERAYHRAHEFSAGKVLVDRFTSTAALWMGDALPVSPTEASEVEPLVSALEPSVGYETPFSIDWSSASIWQKMMLYKEQNLIVTKSTENDDPAAAREATTSNAQLQAESKFDFVRSTAGSEVGPGRSLSGTRRMLPSQQTLPSLWRAMQEDGYSHGLLGLPGPLSRGRYLSLPSLPSPPPSPDSLASPELASAQPRPSLVDMKESLSSLDVGLAGRRGPKLMNLTGLPIFMRTARDAPERGVTRTGKTIDDWLEVVNGCRDGFALSVNESDGSTLPFDLCIQLGCHKAFLERLGSLNQSCCRVHSFRVPVEAFRATNVLRSTPKGVIRDSSPTGGSVENESGILNRARREWTTVRMMVRVELHPNLSVWDVCISSLYTVVNDTSATLVLVGPRREPWANVEGGDVPSGGSFIQTRGAGNHPRGSQSSTRAELGRSTYVPPHLILAPGEAVPIPIDWMLPEQCFRSKPRAIGMSTCYSRLSMGSHR